MHSDADADLPFVREADVAVRLPGNAPADTYLRVDLLLDAARRTGADAVHPGYGFLSENADFARAVARRRADLGRARTRVDRGDGLEGRGQGADARGRRPGAARRRPSPTECRPPAAGEGVGRRRRPRHARSSATSPTLPAEVAAAEAEAASAFGDGTVFVEPYVERGRHVEVQVVGTAHGVLVLGERDCSLQRRHQKVVEEAPAPHLPRADPRARCTTAAREGRRGDRLPGRRHGRVPRTTPGRERFLFLEMNTRLQVEHPVTELVHGVDLVELQLAVAEGGARRRSIRRDLTATRSRCGCTPRTRPPTTSRRAAR